MLTIAITNNQSVEIENGIVLNSEDITTSRSWTGADGKEQTGLKRYFEVQGARFANDGGIDMRLDLNLTRTVDSEVLTESGKDVHASSVIRVYEDTFGAEVWDSLSRYADYCSGKTFNGSHLQKVAGEGSFFLTADVDAEGSYILFDVEGGDDVEIDGTSYANYLITNFWMDGANFMTEMGKGRTKRGTIAKRSLSAAPAPTTIAPAAIAQPTVPAPAANKPVRKLQLQKVS